MKHPHLPHEALELQCGYKNLSTDPSSSPPPPPESSIFLLFPQPGAAYSLTLRDTVRLCCLCALVWRMVEQGPCLCPLAPGCPSSPSPPPSINSPPPTDCPALPARVSMRSVSQSSLHTYLSWSLEVCPSLQGAISGAVSPSGRRCGDLGQGWRWSLP